MQNSRLHHSHAKAKIMVSSLDQLLSDVLEAFAVCPEIQQALILLGSSPVTPKESYIIKLPGICPEADNISLKSSKQALFRHLVAEQVLSSDAALGPTSMYVILRAPQSASLSGFLPKTSFKLPVRGYSLTLNMFCNQPSFCSQDLTLDDDTVEISGIEPLEQSSVTDVSSSQSVAADSFKSPSPEKMSRPPSSCDNSRIVRLRHGSGSEISQVLGDTGKVFHTPLTRSTPKVGGSVAAIDPLYIWFQSSTVVKGYRI